MPAINEKKRAARKADHVSNIPEGFCWTVMTGNIRHNDIEVALRDDDDNEYRANVGRYSKIFDELKEAIENGEVVYLAGGWDSEWELLYD